MSIDIQVEDSGSLRIVDIELVGEVSYQQGRQYPYCCKTGCVVQFFETKSEAVNHALKEYRKRKAV